MKKIIPCFIFIMFFSCVSKTKDASKETNGIVVPDSLYSEYLDMIELLTIGDEDGYNYSFCGKIYSVDNNGIYKCVETGKSLHDACQELQEYLSEYGDMDIYSKIERSYVPNTEYHRLEWEEDDTEWEEDVSMPFDDETIKNSCLQLIQRWNDGQNNQDYDALLHLYSHVTNYYHEYLTPDEISKKQQSHYKKNPDRKQWLENIDIAVINSCTVIATFDKYSQRSSGQVVKKYPSYLEIDFEEQNPLIKTEGDSITDGNLAKRPKPKDFVVTNEMEIEDIFCESNVGKYIIANYWDLNVGGDIEDGPLASAMRESLDFARIGIDGILKKSYRGTPDTYYCYGYCSAGESSWHVIWIYDSSSRCLKCI